MKKNEIIYLTGVTVTWKAGNMDCEGIVRDDLGEKVKVKCISVNGRVSNKEVEIKKELLQIKKVEMGKGDEIKKKLVFTKYKKYSTNQVIVKIEKGGLSDVEIEVFKEILISRGKTEEEINSIFNSIKTEKKEEVVVEIEEQEEIKTSEEKTVHKKEEGKRHIVEIEPEEEFIEPESKNTVKRENKIKSSLKSLKRGKSLRTLYFEEDKILLKSDEDGSIISEKDNDKDLKYFPVSIGKNFKIITKKYETSGLLKNIFYGKYEKDYVFIFVNEDNKDKWIKLSVITNIEVID